MKTDMTVANTILAQLGGNKFIAMTCAKQIVGGAAHLQLKFGTGASNKSNTLRIELMPDDTYTVQFWSVRGLNMKLLSTHTNVYADSLRPLFTTQTGFDTSL